VIQSVLHQNVVDPYPDLRRFLGAIYEKADLAVANSNQCDIITLCIDAFVANDEQSIVEQCEFINSDGLSVKAANIPFKLVIIIYKTILELRKTATIEVRNIVDNTLSKE